MAAVLFGAGNAAIEAVQQSRCQQQNTAVRGRPSTAWNIPVTPRAVAA